MDHPADDRPAWGLGMSNRHSDFEHPIDHPPVSSPSSGRPEQASWSPLSFSQERLWLMTQLEPENPCYNTLAGVRLRGILHWHALAACFAEIARRHEVLRSVICSTGGVPHQEFREGTALTVPIIDLSALPADRCEALLSQAAIQLGRARYDLQHGPVFRTAIVKLGHEDHAACVGMHHIVFDGWSRNVLVRELGTLYAATSAGNPSPLSENEIQYADFAVWQRESLTDSLLEPIAAYWRSQLQGDLPILGLPFDHPRPAVRSFRGAAVVRMASVELAASLSKRSREENVTVFMLLLTAFAAMLHRYGGQNDILVGSPVANRNQRETEELIGFFVNMLPIRIRVTEDCSFRALLAQVKQVVSEALDHQLMPFEQLVQMLQPQRELSHSPIFQAALAFQDDSYRDVTIRLKDLIVESLEVDLGTAVYDVNCFVTLRPDGLITRLEYNCDLFTAESCTQMLACFETLLNAALLNLDTRVSQLPLLNPELESKLLGDWSGHTHPFVAPPTVHQLFEEQAARTPDAIAAIFDHHYLSYQELNRRANQLGHYLRRLQVGPEVCVALVMERSLEMLTAIFGVLKAGGAYVPIDLMYPRDRMALMLADARPPIVLTKECWRSRLPADDRLICCLDAEWQNIADLPASNPCAGATGDDLIYVMYTSGSSGKPKGVMLPHRGIRNRLLAMQQEYQLTTSDRILQKTTFSFDVSVWEIFWPLLNGAAVVLARPGDEQDPAALARLIAEQGITMLHFIPPMLQAFLDLNPRQLEACRSLRHIACGGELLPKTLQQRCFTLLPAELHNHYGPTEGSIEVATWSCKRDCPRAMAPIGRPVRNVRLYVMDMNGLPVPPGVPGELYLGGQAPARGYLNLPELTAEQFVPDAFSNAPGERLYKTGDLTRFLHDGSIEFLGRIDNQVKIRGFRVELGEVQSVLERHPAVRQAIAAAREDTPGKKYLAAYIVLHENAVLPANELKDFLRKRLPEYMVPTAIVTLQQFPMTSTGKLDRAALPAPNQSGSDDQNDYVPPRTPLENKLADIWKEVLGIERVSIRDNFFDVGGYSLVAVEVIARVQDLFGIELPLAALFDAPTIETLAIEIGKQQIQHFDEKDVDALLDEVENLSPEEAQRLLGDQPPPQASLSGQ